MNRSLSEAQTADQIPTGVGQGADAATETLKAWLRERHAYLVGLGAKETYEGAAQKHHDCQYFVLDVFPEPDLKRVGEVLQAAGLSLGQVSASNMRHVVSGLGDIARKGLGL